MKIQKNISSKSQNVYNIIRDKITKGIFAPGQELTEMELCEMFNASRTPIKNALVRLEADGFVEIEPNKGCHVSVITFQLASEMLDVRAALEEHAARICCQQKDPDLIEKLYKLVLEQRRILENSEVDSFIESDVAFHRLIIQGSGSAVWASFWERTMAHIGRIITVCLKEYETREFAVEVHRGIVEDIIAGDAEQCVKKINNHFDDLRRDFLEAIIT